MTTTSASPPRPRGRSSTASPDIAAELGHLTDRDLHLIDLLHQHQVLTSEQISMILFDNVVTARNRLRQLADRDVLAHFRKVVRPGSQEWRWTLGWLGWCYIAARDGTPRPRRTTVTDRVDALATSPQLPHLLGINGFFTALLAHARHNGHLNLDRWWSETACAEHTRDLVRPDGYGRWTDHDRTVSFWLEYDRGTMPAKRVAAKLTGYDQLHAAADHAGTTGLINPVLFRMQTPGDETSLHKLIRHHPTVASGRLVVGTMSGPADTNPAGPVWAATGRRPLRLIDIGP